MRLRRVKTCNSLRGPRGEFKYAAFEAFLAQKTQVSSAWLTHTLFFACIANQGTAIISETAIKKARLRQNRRRRLPSIYGAAVLVRNVRAGLFTNTWLQGQEVRKERFFKPLSKFWRFWYPQAKARLVTRASIPPETPTATREYVRCLRGNTAHQKPPALLSYKRSKCHSGSHISTAGVVFMQADALN